MMMWVMTTSRVNQSDCGDFDVDTYSDHGDDHVLHNKVLKLFAVLK
jgi:hypothetical protein